MNIIVNGQNYGNLEVLPTTTISMLKQYLC